MSTHDEARTAHAWITRTAAIVGVICALVAAGFSAATFFGQFATTEELAAVRERGSEPARALAVTVEAHRTRLDAQDEVHRQIFDAQERIERKVDWLIQVQALTAARVRVTLPSPPPPRRD